MTSKNNVTSKTIDLDTDKLVNAGPANSEMLKFAHRGDINVYQETQDRLEVIGWNQYVCQP